MFKEVFGKLRGVLEKERHYNFEAIKRLEAPMKNVVWQLKEAIDKGEYDTLIGDDASGRIPTLVLRKIMENRTDKLHPDLKSEERNKLLQTYFVAGNTDNEKAITDFLRRATLNDKNKILLVTEYMSSGRSMKRLTEILEGAGVKFDVAVLGMTPDRSEKEYREKYPEMFSRHNFYMYTSGGGLSVWGHSTLAGVQKGAQKRNFKNAHTEPVRKFIEDNDVQDNIIKAREDVNTLARVVLEKVWGDK